MYKSLHSERLRPELGNKKSTKRVVKCNSAALLIALTVLSTALAAYLITVIFKPSKLDRAQQEAGNNTVFFTDPLLLVSDASQFRKRADGRPIQISSLDKASGRQRRTLTDSQSARINLAASEIITTRVEPRGAAIGPLDMERFRQNLARLSRADLLKLLKIVQIRLDHAIKKRQAINTDRLVDSASAQRSATSMSTTSTKPPEVVLRSDKMTRLMRYLDHIESSMPQIDQNQLERLTALDGDQSVVRVVRPEVMNEVLKPAAASKQQQLAELPAISSWREPVESVAPSSGEQWPQEPVEDWPSVTTLAPVTQRPRKKKRKRLSTTTTTTTSTTTQTPETTSSTQAPSQAFEEVWIEEEEDIVRPPKRKTKKYKKKTSQAPELTSTTSTTTTTTTTTTTPAPTTTVQPTIIEDWPEEQWPQQQWPEQQWPQQEQAVSTKSPKLWPDQPQQTPPEEVEKWPEEEWLNELRDDIQSRLHLVYNS